MRYIKLGIVAVILAIFVSSVGMAASAQAEPELLPETNTFTGSGSVGNLNTTGGNSIECKSNSTNGEQNKNTKLWIIILHFKECSKGCKTEGAAAKEIIVNSASEINAHIALYRMSNGRMLYIILILPPFPSIRCTGLTVSVEGELLVDTSLEEKVKTLTITVEANQSAGGVQEVKTCEEPKSECEGKTINLKANFGAGVEEASLVGSDSITFANEVEAVG